MVLLRDNIGGLLATVYSAEVQSDRRAGSEGRAQSGRASPACPVWLRWSDAWQGGEAGQGDQDAILDSMAVYELMEVLDLVFEKPAAPLARCTLNAFCSESESWAQKFPLGGSSKKPTLSSALWPVALWHMHMAVLHVGLLEYTDTQLKTSATTPRRRNTSAAGGGDSPAAGADAEGESDGGVWLPVDMEDDGRSDEEHVRIACSRLLHQCSCVPAGGLGGAGEVDGHVEARVASTVYSLACWATVLLRGGGEGRHASDASGDEEKGQGDLRASVLESVLDSKESKDVLDFSTLTARDLPQVLIATAGSIYRRKKSCLRFLSPLVQTSQRSDLAESTPAGRGVLASLLGVGGAGRGGSTQDTDQPGEADANPHAWAMTRTLALSERDLRAQLEREERVRLTRHLERDSAEAEIAGKLLDESRLVVLSWQTAERRRREAATSQRSESALASRKSWRRTLKDACHHQSIWHSCFRNTPEHACTASQHTPATLFGEHVSTFSEFWRIDAREAGGLGVRRRLKRDALGSAHLQQSYLAFLEPAAPQAPPSREDPPATPHSPPPAVHGGLSRTRESAGALSLVGLEVQKVRACVAGRQSGGGLESGGAAGGKGLLKAECQLISPDGNITGRLYLSSTALVFCNTGSGLGEEPCLDGGAARSGGDGRGAGRLVQKPRRRWGLAELVRLEGRRYMLQATALELSFADGSSVFFNFPGDTCKSAAAPVTLFYKRLCADAAALRHSKLRMWYMSDPPRSLRRYGLTRAWIERRITNFEYLMALNAFAGRTMHDLTQYPVMPWVLADYTSTTLDLSDPRVYRDLSKPIGCQRSSQEDIFKERYRTWADDEIKPFHFGSHYSTAGAVLWYLLRLEPFTSSAIHLQEGHLDCPDRLFRSLAEAYHGCTHSTTDVKELIPEFFYLPDFLRNRNGLDLGVTQHGQQVDDVELPPWATDAADFIRRNREALESEHVSARLHNWIDLIFGYKQRGVAAEEATNVYYYLTYEGQVDLAGIDDELLRKATEAQIANFGQTPRQLFTGAHPPRLPASAAARPLFSSALFSAGTVGARFEDTVSDEVARGGGGESAEGQEASGAVGGEGRRLDAAFSACGGDECGEQGWEIRAHDEAAPDDAARSGLHDLRPGPALAGVAASPSPPRAAEPSAPTALEPLASHGARPPAITDCPEPLDPCTDGASADALEAAAAGESMSLPAAEVQPLPNRRKARPIRLETVPCLRAVQGDADRQEQEPARGDDGVAVSVSPSLDDPPGCVTSPLSSPGSRCSRTTSTDSHAAEGCVMVDAGAEDGDLHRAGHSALLRAALAFLCAHPESPSLPPSLSRAELAMNVSRARYKPRAPIGIACACASAQPHRVTAQRARNVQARNVRACRARPHRTARAT